jgi:PAS domain-containing protein
MEVRNANHELASANRRMEQLLHQMQRQIDRDEISLNIAHDILQQLPLPVIGMDDVGMIAFVNGAAGRLRQQRRPARQCGQRRAAGAVPGRRPAASRPSGPYRRPALRRAGYPMGCIPPRAAASSR